jgi:type II secretory pathway component GspD/PulD (secretin)
MTSIRSLAFLALIAALFTVSGPRTAHGASSNPQQVLLETIVLSIDRHDEVALGLAPLRSRDTLDPALADNFRNAINDAQNFTSNAIGQIQGNSSLASSLAGGAALGLLNNAILNQNLFLNALEEDAKVKVLSRPNLLAINNQAAAIENLKERPIVPGTLEEGRPLLRLRPPLPRPASAVRH